MSSKILIRIDVVLKTIRDFWTVLGELIGRSGYIVLVCQTSGYSALLAQRILACFWKQVDVYLFNFYLHEMGKRRFVKMILRFLLRGRVGILVQSTKEMEYYRSLSRSIEISFYPYCLSNLPAGVEEERVWGREIFAGGYTNRDYETVIKAARLLPHIPFVIACAKANKILMPVPENVEVIYNLSKVEFHRRMARSRLVVVPLKHDVGASGQMVALAAMMLAKPVVYTTFSVVSQYFLDGETGIGVKAGDPAGLVAAILRLYDAPALSEAIGRKAREDVQTRFSWHNFENQIVTRVLQFCRVEGYP